MKRKRIYIVDLVLKNFLHSLALANLFLKIAPFATNLGILLVCTAVINKKLIHPRIRIEYLKMSFGICKRGGVVLSVYADKHGRYGFEDRKAYGSAVYPYYRSSVSAYLALYHNFSLVVKRNAKLAEQIKTLRRKISEKTAYHSAILTRSYQLAIRLSAKKKSDAVDYYGFSCAGLTRKRGKSAGKIDIYRSYYCNILNM